MSSVYKVTEIEGRGLGCIALVDIQKGSLILNENPKICADIEEVEGSSGKCFTYVTKTCANLATFNRKPENYYGTIIFEINIMKNSSPINLNLCQT